MSARATRKICRIALSGASRTDAVDYEGCEMCHTFRREVRDPLLFKHDRLPHGSAVGFEAKPCLPECASRRAFAPAPQQEEGAQPERPEHRRLRGRDGEVGEVVAGVTGDDV